MRTAILIHRPSGSGVIVNDPDYDGDWERRYFPRATDRFDVHSFSVDGTSEGVMFSEELSGPDGMHFTLFREPGHMPEDIRKAKSKLRYQRDVTGFSVVRLSSLVRDCARR